MLHGILGQRRALIAGLQRHRIGQRAFGNHNTGSMCGGMARHAFDLHRHIQQLPRLAAGLIQRLQVRAALQRPGNTDSELPRNQLRGLVHLIVRQVQHPADIADRRPRSHRSEGDNLGHMLLAVFLHDIGDNLIAALIAEVDVNIRHRYPLGIKEALKEQVVFQRVYVGDPQGIRSEASRRRAAARPGNNSVLVTIGNEIPDDQKIIAEAHALNNAQLVVQTLLRRRLPLR
ncbi:hypothetical protein D3C75_439010 [compost metagenome]